MHQAALGPYRQPGLREDEARRPTPRTRSRSAGWGLFHSIGASFLAQGGLLVGSALAIPPLGDWPAAVRAPPARPTLGASFVRAEVFTPHWPPSGPVRACFERETLTWGGYETSPAEAYGYAAWSGRPWQSLAKEEVGGDRAPSDRAIRDFESDWLVQDCVRGALLDGWGGEGRVFVRVARHGDGSGTAFAAALDAAADHPGLLCCLREAQDASLARLRPGSSRRLTFRFGGEAETSRPPTTPEPEALGATATPEG